MKKLIILFCLLISSISGFTQNKKEQIQLLLGRIDSLNTVLSSERKAHSGEMAQLRSKFTELDKQITSLNNQLKELKSNDAQTKVQLAELTGKREKDAQEIVLLQTAIKHKADSLKSLLPKDYSVRIGSQLWMTENLNVGTFRNGNTIPEVRNAGAWEAAVRTQKPAWCYYANDPSNEAKFGKLYNWYAVADSRGLCPFGWHVPSNSEWKVLTDQLGGTTVAGLKMKTTSGWELYGGQISDSNNQSGFSGLPGGNRDNTGDFYGIGRNGYWWSSSDDITNGAISQTLNHATGNATRSSTSKQNGYSVRCLRD